MTSTNTRMSNQMSRSTTTPIPASSLGIAMSKDKTKMDNQLESIVRNIMLISFASFYVIVRWQNFYAEEESGVVD